MGLLLFRWFAKTAGARMALRLPAESWIGLLSPLAAFNPYVSA